MNRWFDELGARLAAAAARRGTKIEAPGLDAEVAGELLELARVAAHTQERRFAPLDDHRHTIPHENRLDAGGVEASEEIVVSAVSASGFTATFSRAYPKGLSSIAAYGNPGPFTTGFQPARHPELVPFFSVIN